MNTDLDPQLSAPTECDLPDGRPRLLEEHFMREIRTTNNHSVRLRVMLGAAIAGTTAVLVGGGFVVSQAIVAAPPTPNSSSYHLNGSASQLLLTMAATVERQAPTEVRNDQWVYVKSTIGFSTFSDNQPAVTAPLHQRELWTPVSGDTKIPAMFRENGKQSEVMTPDQVDGDYLSTIGNYRAVAALPTDPDELLKKFTETQRRNDPNLPVNIINANTFIALGDVVGESIVPPKVMAAIFRAMAKIPGVTMVHDAVDANGRHGIGVAMVGEKSILTTRIFDKTTYAYLGQREILTKDTADGKAGTVLGRSAVITRAIVDHRGQAPTSK
jgi:hypothetical protein